MALARSLDVLVDCNVMDFRQSRNDPIDCMQCASLRRNCHHRVTTSRNRCGLQGGSAMDARTLHPTHQTFARRWRPERCDRVALVLQGGGALGAYQAGVYQALHEAEIEPDWLCGVSIGAINS